jgi:hypothetical protein
MKIEYESIITCPECGHSEKETRNSSMSSDPGK